MGKVIDFKSIKKWIKQNFIIIIAIIILMAIIFCIINTYYGAVRYSVNTLDDFIHYDAFKNIYYDRKFSLFDFAVKYAIWHCVNNGGLYFTMFIQILLGPNPYVDIVSKNEMVMVLNMLFYFVSLYIFILTIVWKIVIKKSTATKKVFISLLLFLTILLLHNSYQFYTEIFTWFSGATSYSIPLSFLFLSLSFFIVYIESHRKIKNLLVIPIAFTSIAALGGSISVICIAFVFMLSLLIYVLLNNKLNIVNIGLFFHYFCFALINVKSPGNYHRLARTLSKNVSMAKEVFDSDRIILVLNSVNKIITDRYVCLFSKYNFLVILIIVSCVVGLILSKMIDNIDYHKIMFTILPLLLMTYLVSLSFAIGYQDRIQVTDRCFFLIDFSIIFTLLIVLTYGFILMYSICYTNNKNIVCELMIIIIVAFTLFSLGNSKNEDVEKRNIDRIELVAVAIDNSICKYKEYHKEYEKIINVLNTNSGKDNVEINYLSYDKAPRFIMKFYDGQHLPYILPDEDYLPYFYDIDKIVVLEN